MPARRGGGRPAGDDQNHLGGSGPTGGPRIHAPQATAVCYDGFRMAGLPRGSAGLAPRTPVAACQAVAQLQFQSNPSLWDRGACLKGRAALPLAMSRFSYRLAILTRRFPPQAGSRDEHPGGGRVANMSPFRIPTASLCSLPSPRLFWCSRRKPLKPSRANFKPMRKIRRAPLKSSGCHQYRPVSQFLLPILTFSFYNTAHAASTCWGEEPPHCAAPGGAACIYTILVHRRQLQLFSHM